MPKILPIVLCAAFVWTGAAQQLQWIDVPFVSQPSEGCGAATIAMIMQYWERQREHTSLSSTVETAVPSKQESNVIHIQQELYSKPAHGIYASDLQQYLQSHSFATYVVRGDLELLTHHIERGRPLIVALKPTASPALHYVVVAGVDPGDNAILVNDPAQRKLLKVDSAAFEKEWQATGNWTLLALPRSASR